MRWGAWFGSCSCPPLGRFCFTKSPVRQWDNRYDTVGAAPLLDGIPFEAFLAGKAFDSNWTIEEPNARGASICISQRPQRRDPLEINQEMYT